MMTKIYDTSSLLLSLETLFQNTIDKTIITSITLKELEQIKTSTNKDLSIKYAARHLLHLLDENDNKYYCQIYKTDMEAIIKYYELEDNNDSKILAAALKYIDTHPEEECIFYTNDLAFKKIAETILPKVEMVNVHQDNEYKGYVDLYLSEEQMADFYSTQINKYNIYVNQYVNIYDAKSRQRVDTLCWTGKEFRTLKYQTFTSQWLGDIKPYKGDIYQAMAADSLMHNNITIIKGPAGAGKSHIALGYLFSLLDKEKISKIIIFCNTVATKNAAKLGYYPGSKDEKLLDSQIGNFLTSKLGDKILVEQLMNEDKLILLPMSDIRGYDTSGMNAGIYITEAQNLDIDLIKLALQRAGEDSIFILDGDVKSQVDLVDYEGINNGMKRVSKVFRGEDIYGEVELQQIHRSKIAEIANKL